MARQKKKELNTSEAKQERVKLISGAGDEPRCKTLVWNQIDLVRGLNYHAAHSEFSKMKEWAISFVKEHRPSLVSKLKSTDDASFMTYGPLCRLSTRGFNFDDSLLKRIFDYFESLPDKEVKEQKVKVKAEKINRSQEAFDLSLDRCLATGVPEVPLLDPSDNLRDMRDYCDRELHSLKEHTEYFKLAQVFSLKKYFRDVKTKIEGILEAKKKKAPVIQKKKTPAEIVKSVKFQKTEPKLSLSSIQPIDLLGKRKVYVYDTAKRRLIKYVASSVDFTFTGTTLQNFDPEKSVSKTIRKPEEFFYGRDLAISALNKAFDSVRAVEKSIETGRFSENFILLKAS